MLDAHPELAIPPETQFLPELIDRGGDVGVILGARTWPDFGTRRGRAARAHRRARRAPGDVARAFYGLYAEREGKPRWGEKTPAYVRHMPAIAAELPEARFVHLIRDGRDVAVSRRRRGMGAGKPMADTARLWRRRIEEARRQSKRLGSRATSSFATRTSSPTRSRDCAASASSSSSSSTPRCSPTTRRPAIASATSATSAAPGDGSRAAATSAGRRTRSPASRRRRPGSEGGARR